MKAKLRFPDFIGIGAPKCATTFISELLMQHPNIYMPPYFKELHYFDKNFHRGSKWYKSFFKNVPENILCGEFTPSYMRLNDFSNKVIKLNPNVKLIACLRDPVKRSLSHFNFTNRGNYNIESFKNFIEDESNNFLDIGLYGKQLKNILSVIPRDKIHVILFEDFIENSNKVIQNLFEFLEVDQFLITEKRNYKIINYKWTIKAQHIINVLGRRYYFFRILFFTIIPFSKILRYINKIYQKKIKNFTDEKLSNDARIYLMDFYSKDKKILEKTLSINIKKWL